MKAQQHNYLAHVGAPSRRLPRAVTVAAATLVPAIVWVAAVPIAGTDLVTITPPQGRNSITLPVIVATGLMVGLAAWALLAGLERLTGRAMQVWTSVAVCVLLASLLPIAFSAASPAVGGWLAAMHIAVAAVLIPGLRRTGR